MATDQQRAEEKVKEAERVLEDAAARAGSIVARLLARTREEAEDIWAEAKSLSRSKR
jgi:F0F1-type ATP synthase membrane subunit b/b'